MSVKNPNAELVGERVMVTLGEDDEQIAEGGRSDKEEFEGGKYYGQTLPVFSSFYEKNYAGRPRLRLLLLSEDGTVVKIWASLVRVVDD